MALNVAEAAKRLGITERRLRALIQAGDIYAERVGGRWVLEEAAVARHEARVARPLSSHNAWAMIDLAEGKRPDLSAGAAYRARSRLRRLLASNEPERLLRSWLSSRAERRTFRASPHDLADLRSDARLIVSGVSHPMSGISASDITEGYVQASDLQALVRDLLLLEAPDGRGNAILHVTQEPVGEVSAMLLAADLAEYRSPRENRRAVELIGALA